MIAYWRCPPHRLFPFATVMPLGAGQARSLHFLAPALYNRAMSKLWIVASPIGNLQDISLRALECLKNADLIACEDTRHSLKLLNHFSISKPLVACYAFREEQGSKLVLGRLAQGQNVAYLSDAGTPSLSDPGSLLCRLARQEGHQVIPIPGASAFACIISVAGLGGSSVHFEGFLSPKPGRRRSRLAVLLGRGDGFVVYESPYRVRKLCQDLAQLCPTRPIVIGREMTKLHEEFIHGDALSCAQRLDGLSQIKGEFTIFVGPDRNFTPQESLREAMDGDGDGDGDSDEE